MIGHLVFLSRISILFFWPPHEQVNPPAEASVAETRLDLGNVNEGKRDGSWTMLPSVVDTHSNDSLTCSNFTHDVADLKHGPLTLES